MIGAVVPREIAEAGVGMAKLLRYDPEWIEAFDASAGGFVRSFAGPILALPFIIIVEAMIAGVPGQTHMVDPRFLWAAGLAQAINTIAFPVLVGLLAKRLDIQSGYGAFMVVVNWSSLFMNLAVTAATSLLLLGVFDLFGLVWLVLFGVWLFVIWRAARETLAYELPTALMMVVLWVGVGVGSDKLGQLLTGAPTVG